MLQLPKELGERPLHSWGRAFLELFLVIARNNPNLDTVIAAVIEDATKRVQHEDDTPLGHRADGDTWSSSRLKDLPWDTTIRTLMNLWNDQT